MPTIVERRDRQKQRSFQESSRHVDKKAVLHLLPLSPSHRASSGNASLEEHAAEKPSGPLRGPCCVWSVGSVGAHGALLGATAVRKIGELAQATGEKTYRDHRCTSELLFKRWLSGPLHQAVYITVCTCSHLCCRLQCTQLQGAPESPSRLSSRARLGCPGSPIGARLRGHVRRQHN